MCIVGTQCLYECIYSNPLALQISSASSFSSALNFANHSICFYVSVIFNLCTHEKDDSFHTKKSIFAGDSAVMASRTSFLASRLPLWCIFCILCL
jgi:hypothetical protein